MRAFAQFVALIVFVVGVLTPATENARRMSATASADENTETWADVHTGATELANALCARGSPLAAGGGAGTGRIAKLRARARELGRDPDRGVVDMREGISGVRLESQLGRQIRRGESGADFVDDAAGGLGQISLKGPLPPRARGNSRGLANAAIDDLAKNSGADSLVIDLTGLSSTAAAEVRSAVQAALPGARYPKTLVFLGR